MDIVGVTFDEKNCIYYFESKDIILNQNDHVIVETDNGLQYGKVVIVNTKRKLNSKVKLGKVIRKANYYDLKKYKNNLEQSTKALEECKNIVKKYNLDMKLLDSKYNFDKTQLIFHFTSDSRVDFRELAKELASKYKTRIELRQVGARDRAKEIGGIGPCGRQLCCSKNVLNFDSVSINMAKNQNLSLNPSKINGCCGRLLCCLMYENDLYTEYKKLLPEIGSEISYNGKKGKVVSLDILNKSYIICTDDEEEITIKVDESTK